MYEKSFHISSVFNSWGSHNLFSIVFRCISTISNSWGSSGIEYSWGSTIFNSWRSYNIFNCFQVYEKYFHISTISNSGVQVEVTTVGDVTTAVSCIAVNIKARHLSTGDQNIQFELIIIWIELNTFRLYFYNSINFDTNHMKQPGI